VYLQVGPVGDQRRRGRLHRILLRWVSHRRGHHQCGGNGSGLRPLQWRDLEADPPVRAWRDGGSHPPGSRHLGGDVDARGVVDVLHPPRPAPTRAGDREAIRRSPIVVEARVVHRLHTALRRLTVGLARAVGVVDAVPQVRSPVVDQAVGPWRRPGRPHLVLEDVSAAIAIAWHQVRGV